MVYGCFNFAAVSKCGAAHSRKLYNTELVSLQGFIPDDGKAKQWILEWAEMI
jgi:hypothetical protein